MDKADIYEHLANIYLNSSRKKKKRRKFKDSFRIKSLLAISLFVFTGIAAIFIINKPQKIALNGEIAFIIQPNAVKINYNFDIIKKEAYSVDLKHLNLSSFKALGFAARKVNPDDVVYLRVELGSVFKEVSEVYVKEIKYRWKNFIIPLSDFKNIAEWADMAKLSFIVEEWNTRNKNGVVYIDEVKFIR